ncbi:pentatricopeptide repeat-containing protein At5g59600 [Coffea eugenioides]|uniref:pentatricopeptide repeat-containing protein At5g59600 n=1 Tax=Coffea eugenioides TaxID=49369 RepID=UPI000F60D0D6|nr:pentatricopeptide repeat-containing protein At5g59600 [Coffea eugenioides]
MFRRADLSTTIVPRWSPLQKFLLSFRPFHSSSNSYTKIIEKFGRDRALQSGRALHAHLIINGLACKPHFASKLIAFYTECKQLSHAQKLFDEIPKSNVRRWVALIGAYARNGLYQEAMHVFSEMQKEGRKLSEFVIPSALKACGQLSDMRTGETVHALVVKYDFESDAFVISALIDMYSKCVNIKSAKRVFDRMVDKDLVALNAMVSGYVQHGIVKQALVLVQEMKLLGMKTNVITWNTIIAGFSQENDEVMVWETFRQMRKDGIEPDMVSWTSVISGFVQNFCNKEAFDTFKWMLDAGTRPSTATISGLLPACATAADIKHGKEIHGYAIVMEMEKDIFVRSALIDMYAKCGYINEARGLFDSMPERNTVTWNSMIFGYANHGHSDKAIELFNKMLREEERELNHLTFTAALTACSHAGMVPLGESLFQLMQEKYGIEPRLEHYACVVDLLGKAGKLAEAYGFIQRMPVEPDSFVWGALLGACRQHGNVDLAEIAADQLVKLEPESRGSSVLLSNLYSASSRWGKATRLKRIMKKKKLKKFPGCSWIEVV